MKITRSIVLAAMAAGACFGAGNAFAQDSSCITAAHGGAPGGQGGTFIGGTQDEPCTITGEVKVFLNKAESHTSTGDVGSQHGTPGIAFLSNDTVRYANGWSTIHPLGTGPTESFPNLHISAVGSDRFTDLTFDLQMANTGTTNLLVSTTDGTELDEGSFLFTNLQHSTDLRFDVFNAEGLTAVDLTTTSPSGIHEVKQIQVSGFTGPIVHAPEPSAFALMLLGVVGVGLAGYRRTRRTRLERDFLWHRNAGAEELPGAIA